MSILLFLVYGIILKTVASSYYDGAIPDQEFGYITVREGAHMFYWFYGATNPNMQRNDLPVVTWLQGGPGAGGSGYGNFGEIGQLDPYLNPRNCSWTNKVNLLFIDNPVGAGYSYVDNMDLLTTNVSQISDDLLEMHKQLTAKYDFMKTLPYWIFSESYGGKMTANFGNVLYDAIENGDIAMNFQGVELGDSWISGIDYVNTWPLYLDALTLIDEQQLKALEKTADSCQTAIDNGNWTEATNLWGHMEGQCDSYTNNADWYYVLQFDGLPNAQKYDNKDPLNILKYNHLDKIGKYLDKKYPVKTLNGGVNDTQIEYIMNGPIKQQLGIIPENVSWGGQSGDVFQAQNGDFMKPVVSDVNSMLKKGIDVNIWNGQLDLICCTLGTLEWLQTITWVGQQKFYNAPKQGILNPKKNDIAYFYKGYLNLKMFYLMKAGHMVPADNPIAAMMGLCNITGVPY